MNKNNLNLVNFVLKNKVHQRLFHNMLTISLLYLIEIIEASEICFKL